MKSRHTLDLLSWRRRCFLLPVIVLGACLLWACLLKLAFVQGAGRDLESTGTHLHRYDVNCSAIYELDPVEVGKALWIRQEARAAVDDEGAATFTSDCQTFIRARGYDSVWVSHVERGFPLAFSLVVHKNAPMVERIIRAIYAPHNIYCVHYDQKSSAAFSDAMKHLARCLPNVFIASKLESVEYAHISRLNADLHCLRDLLRSDVRWEYVINLCGQDFPLRTNRELVLELQHLNHSNMLESSRPSALKKQRFSYRHQLTDVPYEYRRIPVRTPATKAAAPHGIQVFTGSAYFVLARGFVAHVSRSPAVADFLAWSADTYSPDEHFWATLVRIPGVPGHVPRQEADVTDLSSRTRVVKWNYLEGRLYPPCTGTHLRSVCIFGAAELRWLLTHTHWFANKLDPHVDPVLVQCLEEELDRRRARELTFDLYARS